MSIEKAIKLMGLHFNGVYDYENKFGTQYGDLGINKPKNLISRLKQSKGMYTDDLKDPVFQEDMEQAKKNLPKINKKISVYKAFSKKHPNKYTFTDIKKAKQGLVPTGVDVAKFVKARVTKLLHYLSQTKAIVNKFNKTDFKTLTKDGLNDFLGETVEDLEDSTTDYGNLSQDFKMDGQDIFDDDMVSQCIDLRDDLQDLISDDTPESAGAMARAKDYEYCMTHPDDLWVEDCGNDDGVSCIQPLTVDTVENGIDDINMYLPERIKEYKHELKVANSIINGGE